MLTQNEPFYNTGGNYNMPIPGLVLSALIGGGAQLGGQLIGGIGAGIGQRRQEIGSATHAAKLDDIGKQFMNFQTNPMLQQFANKPRGYESVTAQNIGRQGPLYDPRFDGSMGAMGGTAEALQALAGRASARGSSAGLRGSINRELAASGRSAQAALGGMGGSSGAGLDIMGDIQGGALAKLAEAMNQDELMRLQTAGQLQGQAGQIQGQMGQLNLGRESALLERSTQGQQMEYGRQYNNAQLGLSAQQANQQAAQQSQAQQLQALLGAENLQMQSRGQAAQIYQNPAFANPRYDSKTGNINRGK